jgi:hypothetical protein
MTIRRNLSAAMALGTLLLSLLVAGRSFGADRLVLVQNGVPAAAIMIPDDADAWTKMAADWVAEYVKRTTGAELPTVVEGKSPRGPLIAVGHTKLAEACGEGRCAFSARPGYGRGSARAPGNRQVL